MYRIVLHAGMKSATRWVIAIIVVGSMGWTATNACSSESAHVCEVLAEVNRYADSAVLWSADGASVSLLTVSVLVEDKCEHRDHAMEHVWSNKIRFGLFGERNAKPRVQSSTRTINCGCEVRCRSTDHEIGHSRRSLLQERTGTRLCTRGQKLMTYEWAVVYGRIARMPRLSEDCGAEGCEETTCLLC